MKLLKFIALLIVAQLVFAGIIDLDRSDIFIVSAFVFLGISCVVVIDKKFPNEKLSTSDFTG